jgi:hypothetical protein
MQTNEGWKYNERKKECMIKGEIIKEKGGKQLNGVPSMQYLHSVSLRDMNA